MTAAVRKSSTRKRIAYVINTIKKNGPSKVIVGILNNIEYSKFEPVLIVLFNGSDQSVVDEIRNRGIQVIECHHDSRAKYIISGNREYKKIITDNKIDVIHSHGFVPDIMSARIKSVKRINTVHNNMFEDYFFCYGKKKSIFYTKMHLHAMKKLDICVCCSKSVYDVMKKYLRNTMFIRNGISGMDICKSDLRKEMGISETSIVFIYIGAFSDRKRTVQLLEKFHLFHNDDEYLLMIGNGPNWEKCQEIHDDHIRLLGFQDNPCRYMNIADIYISASASEGLSMSALEALSCGLGLFLSDIPSHREFFEISKDTYLGETFLENEFSDALEQLRFNLTRLDKVKVMNLQKMYLSDQNMTREYEKLY